MVVVQWLNLAVIVSLFLGTLASLFRKPSHWLIRNWDFPRVQIVLIQAIAGALYAGLLHHGRWWDWTVLAIAAITVAWQIYKIGRYTPLVRREVLRSERAPRHENSLRLMVCNVLMENRQYERFIRCVEECDPDVLLILEPDQAWIDALSHLRGKYPHVILRPQANMYGIALYSRLELIGPHVRFLVQGDIPSVHTKVVLRSGKRVMLHGLHPRPPEPIRDQDSGPRDAELILLGKQIGNEEDHPTIVAGDLNDVAWSPTSELFLRISGLLDPRRGRGLYNSFNANSRIMRFPLDHVFHTNDFKLIELRVLDSIGSDHFPVLIELSLEPRAEAEQPEPAKSAGDNEAAEEKIEDQAKSHIAARARVEVGR